MNEITPDLVAQIASRLYNAGPHSGPAPDAGLAGAVPSFEGAPAIPTAPLWPQVGPLPTQPSSVQTPSLPGHFGVSPSSQSANGPPWSGSGGLPSGVPSQPD